MFSCMYFSACTCIDRIKSCRSSRVFYGAIQGDLCCPIPLTAPGMCSGEITNHSLGSEPLLKFR